MKQEYNPQTENEEYTYGHNVSTEMLEECYECINTNCKECIFKKK